MPSGDPAPFPVKPATVAMVDATDRSSQTSTLPVTLTSFIGRASELEQLRWLVLDQNVRILTLTGPGGVGKTRLALRAARDIESSGAMGVTFVGLVPLTDSKLVASAIGQAFGMSDTDAGSLPERLAWHLKDVPHLLVIDNFEHVLDAAPVLSALVAARPSLSILVTSRVRLRLTGEEEYQVQPLSHGVDDAAIDLFLDRAGMYREFLTERDLSAIAAICGKLDGIPLAIELAAAKTRLLSPAELAERLDHALPMLTDSPRDAPERHRTMRGAIAWSYDLLSASEQSLFRMVSVFSGGFTVADVEGIAQAESIPDVLTTLQSLLDHSLIRRMEGSSETPRFTMLETIRQFGNERLVESDNERDVRDRHAAWFASRIDLPELRYWMTPPVIQTEYSEDQDNFRTALRWSVDRGDAMRAARLALGLAPLWWRQGYFTEGREAVGAILALPESRSLPDRRDLLGLAADFAYFQSDFDAAGDLAAVALQMARIGENPKAILNHLPRIVRVRLLDPPSAIPPAEEVVELAAIMGDTEARIQGLHMLAMIKVYVDRLDEAITHAAEARSLLSTAARVEGPVLCECIQMEGTLLFYAGDYERAEPLLTQALALRQAQGNKVYEHHCLRDLGRVALALGNLPVAAGRFAAALEIAYLLGAEHCKSYCFDEAAAVSTDLEAAAQLLGASSSIRSRLKLASIQTERALRAETTSRVSEALGAARFEAAFSTGQRLSSMEAYEVARHALSTILDEPAGEHSLLTPREREVLILITEGKSDREIADALFVSRRTAATHVRNVLAKLDVHSRAAAAAWAVRNEIA